MRKSRLSAVISVLVAVTMVTLLTTGCTTYKNFKETFFGGSGEISDTIKIGVLEPRTGNDSPKGDLEIQGIELANKVAPQVLGKDIELVYADTQSSIYVAESAAENLAAKSPAVVLGSYGDAVSLTASQIFGKRQIPAIAITVSNPLITANNPYYFRVNFTDASQGRALAEYVFEYLKEQKAVVVKMLDEDTATEMSSQFSQELVKRTGDEECVSTIEIPKTAEDFSSYARELKESGVTTVFMPTSLKNTEKMLKAMKAEGITNVNLLGPKDWHEDKLLRLQQQYPGIQLTVASDFSGNVTADAKTTELHEKFLEVYSRECGKGEPPEEVALAFDAYMIAVEAIAKAGTVEGEAVKDMLLSIDGFGGASGEISINDRGEPKKDINIDIIRDNGFVSAYTVK